MASDSSGTAAGVRTTFDCLCGSDVRAEGSWENDGSADLMEACNGCGREYILTLTSLSDGRVHLSPTMESRQYLAELAVDTDEGSTNSPLEIGDEAPDFELPGVGEDGIDRFRLSDHLDSGPTLLSFYPFDFSPVCTSHLCRFRDSEWLQVAENTDVFAISGDSVYAHRAFRRENEFQFPLLTDRLASVAEAFGVRYDEWENHPAVCQRVIFGIDSDGTVGYRWHTDDATEEPNLDDLETALEWAS